ncbi:MAG: hypothetical protein AAGJ31_16405, partial [Verrucomicrobiota bacterium]
MNPLLWSLPWVMPRLVQWAEVRQEEVLQIGDALTGEELDLAWKAGVKEPERIRIQVEETIPMPRSWGLRTLANWSSMGFEPAGLSLGYAVMVRAREGRTSRLVTHEFVHTAQYEEMGTMSEYLGRYIEEC